MNYETLEHRIKMRFWMCNQLTEKQSTDYAAIAVHEFKKEALVDHTRGNMPSNIITRLTHGEEL